MGGAGELGARADWDRICLTGTRFAARANYANAKFKSSEKKINGVKQPCIQIEQRGATMPLLCIDESNHAPSQLQWAGYTFLFSDYRQEGSGVLPFSFLIKENGSETLSGSVTKIVPISDLQTVLSPPTGSSPLAGLACIAGSDDIKHHTDPIYPATAKMARIQGVVTLNVDVDESGRVRSVRVISGHPMLTPAAASAVSHWEFKPHVCDGQSVGSHRVITVDFKLE
jgi:TonB family protein